ncbi:MAG: AarF/UbiB family protein [Firmicutes bacterium]|uniref:Ubiquinone biosynthesis protein n=1 Tax=Melghirimyces thermohalophilus TaxID=1236220 RepID=A0A1G6I576_9BACL|nr:AarF/UbiB family protein [Melghirimyces thermohalophilus]MDA8353209.1 AarF/UbiB family protein [Bacillota bacterium]SDC01692.1 ubiquinone biosynthesis protein [Melghirimyces thermohalophilus]
MGAMPAERLSPEEERVFEGDKEHRRQEIEMMRARITRSRRFRAMVRVFTKHGLMHLLDPKTGQLFGGVRGREDEERLRNIGRRLRLAFEELGPTFIKLGQVLVTRQELLPDPVTAELAQLMDEVPPEPFSRMAVVLDDDGPESLQAFEWIDPEPIGSASLAQVYRARLQDGRECAVKVVRPTVDKLFQTDIAIIRKMAGRLHKRLPPQVALSVDLPGLIDDYYSSSVDELDMRSEARNMKEHARLGEEFETIGVPDVYYASSRVLVMEFIDGWNLKEFPVDFFTFEERFERMVDLAHYYVKTFSEGYYHADPHGSNLMVDKRTKKIIGIDWGMVGRMDTLHTEAIFRSLLHIRLNQAEDAAESALDLIQPTAYTDPVRLKDELRSMCIHYVNSEQGSRFNWGHLLLQLIQIGMRNHCRIPTGLALWSKGFTAAEGTARWLCPEISYHTVVESADVQILRRWLSRRFNFRANASLIAEMGKLAGTLPRRLNKILEKLAWNDLKVPVEHRIPDESARLLNRTVNRLTLGILAGALFAGSAMLVTFGANGIDEMPLIRWLGEGMLWGSAVLSVYVIWRVIRSKRG